MLEALALPPNCGISKPGEKVFFFYEGYFSQAIVEACADALRMRIDAMPSENSRTRRKLIGAFIELAQNIVHYSADAYTPEDLDDHEVRYGSLRVEAQGDNFVLRCANPVSRAGSERLEKKLGLLVTMSLEEIKQSYRASLRAEGEADSKGGGIGLLTLARDAVEPLQFSFDEIEGAPELRMFNLIVKV